MLRSIVCHGQKFTLHPISAAILLLVTFSASLHAVTKPVRYVPAVDAGEILDYVQVSVNGAPRQVAKDAELVVVAGDRLLIHEAVLVSRQRKVQNVNLIGFQPKTAVRRAEDRRVEIDTASDMLRSWSVAGNGELYEIHAFSGKILHGKVNIHVITPQLRRAVVRVNGVPNVLREGELFKMKGSDEFKIDEIATNVENDQEKVEVQLIPVHGDVKLPGVKFFEMQFLRGEHIFARIPLQVDGHETTF